MLIQPGVYRETADATNGLHITKSIQLVGLSTRRSFLASYERVWVDPGELPGRPSLQAPAVALPMRVP